MFVELLQAQGSKDKQEAVWGHTGNPALQGKNLWLKGTSVKARRTVSIFLKLLHQSEEGKERK